MRIKKTLGLLACSLLLLVNGNAQILSDTTINLNLTFENALELTRLNNHAIKQLNAELEEKQHALKAAKGLYYPNISLSANAVHMSDDLHLDMTSVQNSITPIYEQMIDYLSNDPTAAVTQYTLESYLAGINQGEWDKLIQDQNFAALSVGFTQPIYVGGKIRAANKVAELELENCDNTAIEKDANLYKELVERYYGLVLAMHVIDVRESVDNTMQKHLSDAQKMMEQGVVSNTEYLHAKVYASESSREIKKANRQFMIVNDALLSTLSIDESPVVVPITQLFYLNEIDPLSYFHELALSNSPLLMQIKNKQEMAEQGYKAEFANYLPTVAAMGTYDIANWQLSEYAPEYLVGVNASWDLFKGNARKHKVAAARFKETQVEEFYLKSELDILTAVTKYYQELMMYTEQLEELNDTKQFAEEYYKVRERAFREGMATTAEVSDAELVLAKVKIDRLQSMYKCDVALTTLLYYAGIPDKFQEYQTSTNAIYE